MKSLTLTRFGSTEDGVIGRMGPWCTLEEEDKGNQRNISCIPTGAYVCERTMFHGYETFRVLDVEGRDGILIHRLNTEEDTEGCIGLGMRFGFLDREDEDTHRQTRKLAILSSTQAHDEFMLSLRGSPTFVLVIQDYKG